MNMQREDKTSSLKTSSFRRPPVGIKPRMVMDEARITEIKTKVIEYVESEHKIPVEWINEYNEIIGRKYKE